MTLEENYPLPPDEGLAPATHALPVADATAVMDAVPAVDAAPARERRSVPLGGIAFAVAVVLVIVEAIAVTLANSGQPAAATTIGQVLVVLTALPLALGLYAAVRGMQREWGIAAMVVAVIANPLILINVLSFFGALG
jgi:hypothetical protein